MLDNFGRNFRNVIFRIVENIDKLSRDELAEKWLKSMTYWQYFSMRKTENHGKIIEHV